MNKPKAKQNRSVSKKKVNAKPAAEEKSVAVKPAVKMAVADDGGSGDTDPQNGN